MTNLTAEEMAIIEDLRERRGRSVESQERATHLVVIRESSKKAIREDNEFPEFVKMAQQVLDRADVRDLPGALLIRKLAGDIVRTDARAREIRELIGAETIYDGRLIVGHAVRVEDVVYVLAIFSAAKTTTTVRDNLADMDNAFSNAVARLVYANRAEHLYTGPFHRLVRHREAGAKLRTNLVLTRTAVHYAGGELDMGDPRGQDFWDILAMMAEAQYKGTVTTLTNGAHSLLEAGLWPKAENQLPAFGYKFRAENDRTVVPDPEAFELVRDLIGWAADPTLSDLDIAKKLGARGFISGVQKSRNGGETIMDARYPETAVRNLLKKGLPLWETGRYEYRTDIPQHIGTADLRPKSAARVETAEDGGERVAVFELDFHHEELPGGEWADAETIAEAKRLRLSKKAKSPKKPAGRAAAQGPRKPLAGVAEWTDGATQFRISARHRTHYRLIARDASKAKDAEGAPLGWQAEDYKDVRAVINPAELHRTLAGAVIDALEDGTDWTRTLAASGDPEAAGRRVAELAAVVEKIDGEITRAEEDYELARETGLRETMRDRMRLIEQLRRDKIAAHEDMAAAQGAVAEARELAAGVRTDGKHVAALFAKLARSTVADQAFNFRCRETFADLRAEVSPDGMRVLISTRVKIPTSDGQVVVGPITCEVANRRRMAKDERPAAMFERFFRDGATLEEAAAACGYTDLNAARRAVRRQLEASGLNLSKGMTAAALSTPHPDIRRVLWAEMQARRTRGLFRKPKGVPSAYAHHVRAVYASTELWPTFWAEENEEKQAALDTVAAAGETGLLWDDFLEAHPMPRHIARELVAGMQREGRNDWEPLLDRSELWHRHNRDRRVFARRCPHCERRTLTRIVRAPEVPGGLICTACRRTADGPAELRMPEAYI